MIDKKDKATLDAFPVKRRGRPSTSSDEKRKADTAARVKKHREKQAQTAIVMKQIVTALSSPTINPLQRLEWLNMLSHVNGLGQDLETKVDYLTPSGREGTKKLTYSALCELIIKGYTVVKFS